MRLPLFLMKERKKMKRRGKIGRTLRRLAKKIIRRKAKKRGLRIMYAKGRKMKKINRPKLQTHGIMVGV